jgi:hypothetical protein
MTFPFESGYRSTSLGDANRSPPSLSSLIGFGRAQPLSNLAIGAGHQSLQSPAGHDNQYNPERGLAPPHSSLPYRSRLQPSGRGQPQTLPAHAGADLESCSSVAADRDRESGSGTSDRPDSRFSFGRSARRDEEAEDEPLLFDMSEIGRAEGNGRVSIGDVQEHRG